MSYDSIKLEKGMYAVSGKSFSEVLEELDPSEAYAGTSLDGLDAFGRPVLHPVGTLLQRRPVQIDVDAVEIT